MEAKWPPRGAKREPSWSFKGAGRRPKARRKACKDARQDNLAKSRYLVVQGGGGAGAGAAVRCAALRCRNKAVRAQATTGA